MRATTELELRAKLAARAERQSNEQARRLCAVSSKRCRAGEPEDWVDIESGGRTYCFCAAHALAAEVNCCGGLFFTSASLEETIARIRAIEARHK